jgi:hypothetical protein
MTIEGSNRLKVIYASAVGFHAVDMDTGANYDLFMPPRSGRSVIHPHAIIAFPSADTQELLLCYDNEGVYVNTFGDVVRDIRLQWGEMPMSVGKTHLFLELLTYLVMFGVLYGKIYWLTLTLIHKYHFQLTVHHCE